MIGCNRIGEVAELFGLLAQQAVGGIEEDEMGSFGGCVGGEPFKEIPGNDLGAIFNFEDGDIFPEQIECAAVGFEKRGVDCAAAEAFETHGARAGEEIVDARAFDVWGEDVEEGLFDAVGDGAGGVALGGE